MKVYDTDGKLQVSGGGSVDNLDDIGDVEVPTPSNNDFFYYDSATGLWKPRTLVDADIPAAIARDTEVAADIATHAALATGVHGVGARHVAETSVADLDLAAHASRHKSGGSDDIKLDDLAAPDDNTDLNASITKHGLLKKLDNVATNYLNGQGAWTAPAGGGGGTKIQDADSDTKVDVEESADEDRVRMDVAGVEAFNLNNVGILTLAKQSGFAAHQTSNQSIPHTTNTVLNMDVEDYDVQGEYNLATDRFTATVAGLYLCAAHLQLNSLDDGKYMLIYLAKNGTNVAMAQAMSSAADQNTTCPFVYVVQLAVNDYLEFLGRHNNGAALNTVAGAERVWCCVAKIA